MLSALHENHRDGTEGRNLLVARKCGKHENKQMIWPIIKCIVGFVKQKETIGIACNSKTAVV